MKQRAIVDRFESGYVVLESEQGDFFNISLDKAPPMLGEGMVVWYEGDAVLSIDHQETARRENEMQRRFERLLGRRDNI